MDPGQRAWQRALKNGRTEMFVAVEGCASLRVVGERSACEQMIESFEHLTGAEFVFDQPPAVIPGQLQLEGC